MPCGVQAPACEKLCWECTGADPGGTVRSCLRVTIAGIVAYSGYGGHGEPDCCPLLNGTHDLANYHRLQPGERWNGRGDSSLHGCVWWGPIARSDCDCPQYWLSAIFQTTDTCRLTLHVTKERPYATLTGGPDWLMSVSCRLLDDQNQPRSCATSPSLCELLAGGIEWPLYGGCCGDPSPEGYVCWMLEEGNYYGYAPCCWSSPLTARLNTVVPECCRPIDPRYCCCVPKELGSEPEALSVVMSGIGPQSCQCHNGWPWVLRIPRTGCARENVSMYCLPTPLGDDQVTLTLDRANRRVSFRYGDPVFEGQWDGVCQSLDNLVLSYKSGDTHGCDFAQATATVRIAAPESYDSLEGPDSTNKWTDGWGDHVERICSECPRPKHMYVTLSGLSQVALPSPPCNPGLVLDMSGMNGVWALPVYDRARYYNWPEVIWPCECSTWGMELGPGTPVSIKQGETVVAWWTGGRMYVRLARYPFNTNPSQGELRLMLRGNLGPADYSLTLLQKRFTAESRPPDEPVYNCFGTLVEQQSWLNDGVTNQSYVHCPGGDAVINPGGSWSVSGGD